MPMGLCFESLIRFQSGRRKCRELEIEHTKFVELEGISGKIFQFYDSHIFANRVYPNRFWHEPMFVMVC